MDALADRNLLFGLLALQVGMVDQPALIVAFNAWTRGKSRPLDEILLEQGAIEPGDRDALAVMAARHLERHAGDAARSLAAVPSPTSLHASLAGLADPDLDTTLGHASTARSDGPDSDSDAEATGTYDALARDGRRFQVLRPHARGGLGEVFVALDSELGREVALKQILDRHADDPTSRARFVLEAEITGNLEHPGIVPVYGLGTHGDGRPYYAMRFIRGDSLKEAIAAFHADESLKNDPGKRSLALRKLLRRFVDVCNSVEYAHARGVLHRDLKPANVIVGKHGETLVVDWGLAKAMGQSEPKAPDGERALVPSSASGSDETLPGSAIGTPGYMSPEQAAGDLDRLGPRSDVYGLGATLYCLLTGQAPFEGDDLGAVLRDVEKGHFPPPRQVAASIDPALEAVCLKAMATVPEGRYPSARALADDLERWSADEPVSGWREPWPRRARRWARRNRTAVTAAAVALLAGVVGLASVLAVQTKARNELAKSYLQLCDALDREQEANAALDEANGQVRARFELAREAIRSFKAGVEEDEALREDRLKPLRDKLLGLARQFYDKLGALLQGQPDAASKAILAESYTELGELIDKIGQKPEALAAYQRAVALRRELAALPGAGPSARVELANVLNSQGDEAFQLSDHAGALAAYEEARALAGPLATGPGATLAPRRALGNSYLGSGIALGETGKAEQAIAALRRALEVREAVALDEAAVPRDRRDLAIGHNQIGILLESAGDTAGALAEHRKNQELMRALADEAPTVADYRRELAVGHGQIGGLLESAGDAAGALAEQRKYEELMRALAVGAPAVAQYRRDLAISHSRIGGLLAAAGDAAGALTEQRRCQELLQTLADEAPAVADYRRELAVTHDWIGHLLELGGDVAGALTEQRRHQQLMRGLVDEAPAVADYRRGLAISYSRIGILLATAGKSTEALAEHEKAQSLLEALVVASPGVPEYRNWLTIVLNMAGDALRDLGLVEEARDRYARAVALAESLASADPKATAYQARLASGLCRLAHVRLAAGDVAGAVADARRAVGIYEVLPSLQGANWYTLACVRATLADAAGRDDQGRSSAEASELADRAMADLGRAIAMGYRNPAVYRRERALDPLRGRDDFRLLMLELTFPADPFAR